MEAQELMVGDWVAFRGHPYQYTAQDIATMAECEEKGIATDTTPIPLTPEILEKNGFVWNEYHTSQDFVCGTIHLGYGFYKNCISAADWDENGKVQIVSLECKYVHEFQRALRCVGLYKLANSIKL